MNDVGRNDPCPCGSGAKYKYCCLRKKKQGTANDDLSEDDGADRDLQTRLEEARRVSELAPDESPDEAELAAADDTIEDDGEQLRRRREAFWDRFMDADFEEKLELSAEVIENKPWFDGEDAFYLFVDQLEREAAEHDARHRWLELFDLLREHRPEVMKEESVYLGRAALRFVLALEENQRIDEVLDLLFYKPADEFDLFINVLPSLMYHGIEGVYQRLEDGWEQVRDSEGLGAWAFSDWADEALWFLIVDWAGEDPRRSRGLEDVQEAMGEMFDELDAKVVEKAITGLLGRKAANVDGQSVADIENQQDRAKAIGNGFGNSLITEEDWPPGKAVLAARYMGGFLDYCAEVDDPFSDRFTTDRARKSKLLNRELKRLRKPWREGGEFVPHPDLSIGYTRAILYAGQFGLPYCAAAFFEAVTRLAPWMHRRGFIDDAELVHQIQNHLKRRIGTLSEEIVAYGGFDPGVARGMEEAKRLLNGDG